MGEGEAHQTDPYPNPQLGATRRFGEVVPRHQRRSAKDSRPDGLSGRRAALETAAEIAGIVRASEETVRALAQALPR